MNNNRQFIEDDFSLEEFNDEFNRKVEENFYEKNKAKFNLLHFLIMIASVAVAFLLYMVLQNYINSVAL